MPATAVWTPLMLRRQRGIWLPSCWVAPARRCARCSGAEPIACVLVTRPAELAEETADLLRAAGHTPIIAPLMVPVAVRWELPAEAPDALLLTSPQAARLAGEGLAALRGLPAYAVGARTADAARAAGLRLIRAGEQDAAALIATAAADRRTRLLHLAGADRTQLEPPTGTELIVRIVYESRLVPVLPEHASAALRDGWVDWVLLFSSRSARHFAALYDAAGLERARLRVAALSSKVLAAAGLGWAQAVAATRPATPALLAAAGLACHKRSDEASQGTAR